MCNLRCGTKRLVWLWVVAGVAVVSAVAVAQNANEYRPPAPTYETNKVSEPNSDNFQLKNPESPAQVPRNANENVKAGNPP